MCLSQYGTSVFPATFLIAVVCVCVHACVCHKLLENCFHFTFVHCLLFVFGNGNSGLQRHLLLFCITLFIFQKYIWRFYTFAFFKRLVLLSLPWLRLQSVWIWSIWKGQIDCDCTEYKHKSLCSSFFMERNNLLSFFRYFPWNCVLKISKTIWDLKAMKRCWSSVHPSSLDTFIRKAAN